MAVVWFRGVPENGPACSQFFLNGKTLPVERGLGLQQPAMQTAAQLLARGDWVHLFPEGRVGFSGRLQPCKWGVGKLICDAVAQSGRSCPALCTHLPWRDHRSLLGTASD